MIVGVPTEVKSQEYRVACTPAGAHELAAHGHEVVVQSGAGVGAGITDRAFVAAGATIVPDAGEVWAQADLVLKVKEPIPAEYPLLRRDQVLFTFLHLAASRSCTQALLDAGTVAFAYEAVRGPGGSLPLLAPMSEIAGRMAPQVAAYTLERHQGGRGVLLGGVPGVPAGRVVVLGAGTAGLNAARVARGMGADVVVVDRDVTRLREVDRQFGPGLRTLVSQTLSIAEEVEHADVVVGAVLIPEARAPRLVSDDVVRAMRPGAVVVDISVDQGGCVANSRPTTHADPTFVVHDVVFYCVANMPGAVPATSTAALTNVTLPWALRLADRGWRDAARGEPGLAAALATAGGVLTSAPVGAEHALEVTSISDVLSG